MKDTGCEMMNIPQVLACGDRAPPTALYQAY